MGINQALVIMVLIHEILSPILWIPLDRLASTGTTIHSGSGNGANVFEDFGDKMLPIIVKRVMSWNEDEDDDT